MNTQKRDSIVERLRKKHGGETSEFWKEYYDVYDNNPKFRSATLEKFGLPPEIKREADLKNVSI